MGAVQDVSFWLPESGFTENNLCEVVRSQAGDLVESVALTDTFTNPKKGKTSNCFRIAYRSMERSLTDEEINTMQVRHGSLRAQVWRWVSAVGSADSRGCQRSGLLTDEQINTMQVGCEALHAQIWPGSGVRGQGSGWAGLVFSYRICWVACAQWLSHSRLCS